MPIFALNRRGSGATCFKIQHHKELPLLSDLVAAANLGM